jgi:hypothetical protein
MNDNLAQALEALHEAAGTLQEAVEQMLTNRLEVTPEFIDQLVADVRYAGAQVAGNADKR